MANNDPRPHLLLLRGEDPVRAATKFTNFVTGTGGNEVNVKDDQDLFDQWQNLKTGDGVLFTRSSHDAKGVMTATVVKITPLRKLENRLPKPPHPGGLPGLGVMK